MIKDDWEKEADLDQIYALERATLMEQEYYDSIERIPAQIIYKKDENRRKDRHGVQQASDIDDKLEEELEIEEKEVLADEDMNHIDFRA